MWGSLAGIELLPWVAGSASLSELILLDRPIRTNSVLVAGTASTNHPVAGPRAAHGTWRSEIRVSFFSLRSAVAPFDLVAK
jgi:hypothetical protein